MERIIFEGMLEDNDIEVLHLPVPDIPQEELGKIVQGCQKPWTHFAPLVHGAEFVPHFLHWNERHHAVT